MERPPQRQQRVGAQLALGALDWPGTGSDAKTSPSPLPGLRTEEHTHEEGTKAHARGQVCWDWQPPRRWGPGALVLAPLRAPRNSGRAGLGADCYVIRSSVCDVTPVSAV